MIHRNTYINAPTVLSPLFEARRRTGLFFAGQMSGVEGYVESAASGLIAGIAAAARTRAEEPLAFPEDTALGALGRYISGSDPRHYQPTNIAFGLLPELSARVKDKARRRLAMAERALRSLEAFGSRLSAGADGPARAASAGLGVGRAPVEAARGAFLLYLARERNASPHTIRAYGDDLRQFIEHLRREVGHEPRPQEVDTLLIRGFLSELHRAGVRKTSAARKLATLRTFFRFLCREGVLESNPARALLSPRVEKRVPEHLPEDHMAALLDVPGDGLAALRARAMLELLYGTGIRCAELVGLDRDSVDLGRAGPARRRQGTKGAGGSVRATRASRSRRLPRRSPQGRGRGGAVRERAGRRASATATSGWSWRAGCARWPSIAGSAPTRCGTASRRTSSSAVRTSVPSRSCWATPTCRPLNAIRT